MKTITIEIKSDSKKSIKNCLNLRAKKESGEILTQEENDILNEFENLKNKSNDIKMPFLDILNQFSENIKLFIERYKFVLYEGAKTGYFPPMGINVFDANNENEILSFFKENYSEIKSDLLAYFLNKPQQEALKESFEIFELGKYRGAITVMIPIIDSIFYDRKDDSSFEIFSNNRKNKPKREAKFSEIPTDDIKWVLLKMEEFDISKSIKPEKISDEDWESYVELIKSGKMINRHLISHGKVFDYGNENNFFRVLSLLNFLMESESFK